MRLFDFFRRPSVRPSVRPESILQGKEVRYDY
jgi:hypothetical protein